MVTWASPAPPGWYDSSVPAGRMDHSGSHVVRVGDVAACWRGATDERGCGRRTAASAAGRQPPTGKLLSVTCIVLYSLLMP